MTNFLALLSLINQLLPLIHQAVTTVEALFPQGGQGAQKLKMVDDVVQAAARATGVAESQLPALSTVLGPVVAGVVSLANASGIFKKDSPN